MRAKLNLLSTLLLGTLGGVLAGCQTYDFEPVDPLAISQKTETRRIEARESKPNMMLLVDTSGSMTDPVDPERTNSGGVKVCKRAGVTCGQAFACDTAVCPTRWTELQDAMKSFLASSGEIARIGLATYPNLKGGDTCGASTAITVPLPAEDKDDAATLKGNAELVSNQLLAIRNSKASDDTTTQIPEGGTPTGLSLQYLGTRAELQGTARSDFVLLLTDGLPNCNATFPKPSPDPACFCTLSTCASGSGGERIGCLDTDASVAAVQALRNRQIQTIVIGFGTDFTTSTPAGIRGAATLNGMAEAGGFARKCSTNAECGTGDTCDTARGLCTRRFYQASNRAELVEALRQISEIVKVDEPCTLTFAAADKPSSQDLVVVFINDVRLEPGPDTWVLTAAKNIEFQGATCERIKNSTTASPVEIEVRAVQTR